MLNRIAEYAKPESFAANTDITPFVFFATDQFLEIIYSRTMLLLATESQKAYPALVVEPLVLSSAF